MRRFFVVLLLVVTVTACWDMVDIDERSLVLGVAIDRSPDPDYPYKMTIEIPIIAEMGANKSGEGSSANVSLVPSTLGYTVAGMATNFEKRFWRQLFFGHTKILIISEEVAREGIRDFIDFFDRNPLIDRRLVLVIAVGDARAVLTTNNPREPISSIYLKRIFELRQQTARVITRNLQDSLILLESGGSVILPRVRPNENEVAAAGAAVIKDWKLVGYLGEEEARAVQFLYNTVRGGRIQVKLPCGFFTYLLQTSRTTIKPQLEGGMHVSFEVRSEGDLQEVVNGRQVAETHLDDIERKLNQVMEEDMTTVLHKLQREFQADALGLLEIIRRSYPEYYLNHKEDWEEGGFQELTFSFKADFKVRRTGVLE